MEFCNDSFFKKYRKQFLNRLLPGDFAHMLRKAVQRPGPHAPTTHTKSVWSHGCVQRRIVAFSHTAFASGCLWIAHNRGSEKRPKVGNPSHFIYFFHAPTAPAPARPSARPAPALASTALPAIPATGPTPNFHHRSLYPSLHRRSLLAAGLLPPRSISLQLALASRQFVFRYFSRSEQPRTCCAKKSCKK